MTKKEQFNRVFERIKHPRLIIFYIMHKYLSKFIKDDLYLRIIYKTWTGKKLNLDNPITYNEKMQWLKLHNQNPLYTSLVDKVEVKKYVDGILGPGHPFPLLGSWDSPDEIDFDSLPNEFVLKCNHNSADGMAICKDKKHGIFTKAHGDDRVLITKEQALKRLRFALSQDYFLETREWPYKNVKRKVFAEQFMRSDDGEPLKDYKILCFDGDPKYIWVGSNYTPMWFDLYSAEWKNLHVKWGYDAGPDNLPRPAMLEELLETARKLSKGIPHVRVDLYSIGNKVYFGEYTFFTWGGLGKLEPEEWDFILGKEIKLPYKKFENNDRK